VPEHKDDDAILKAIKAYEDESESAREYRKYRNTFNWNMWNQNQDYTYKEEDESQEFVPILDGMVEQLVSTVQDALTGRSDDYFAVKTGIIEDEIFDRETLRKLILHANDQAKLIPRLSEAIKYVGLDGVVTAKVGGKIDEVPHFNAPFMVEFVKDKETGKVDVKRKAVKKKDKDKPFKKWIPTIDILDFDDFHYDPQPHPDGDKLYEIHVVDRDLHELIHINEYEKIYDKDALKALKSSAGSGGSADATDQERQERRNNQADIPDIQDMPFRKRVTLKECWGTFLDPDGEVLNMNGVATIADNKVVLRKLADNMRMDGKSPFVTASLISNPKSPYPKALLDGSASLQKAYNELFNLLLDGAFNEAHNIIEVNRDALEEPEQASDGFRPNEPIITNNQAGGAPAVRVSQTGRVPQGGLAMADVVRAAIFESGLSSELRAGQLPPSSAKATSIVEAQQAINGVFAGLTRIFEDNFVVPLIQKNFANFLQHVGKGYFQDADIVGLVGIQKAQQIFELSDEERFQRGTSAGKVVVRGISGFVNRIRDFQKLTTLLNTVFSNELLTAEFQKENSPAKIIDEIMRSIGFKADSIRLSDQEKKTKQGVDAAVANAIRQAGAQGQPQNGSSNGNGASAPAQNVSESNLPDLPGTEVPQGAVN